MTEMSLIFFTASHIIESMPHIIGFDFFFTLFSRMDDENTFNFLSSRDRDRDYLNWLLRS